MAQEKIQKLSALGYEVETFTKKEITAIEKLARLQHNME